EGIPGRRGRAARTHDAPGDRGESNLLRRIVNPPHMNACLHVHDWELVIFQEVHDHPVLELDPLGMDLRYGIQLGNRDRARVYPRSLRVNEGWDTECDQACREQAPRAPHHLLPPSAAAAVSGCRRIPTTRLPGRNVSALMRSTSAGVTWFSAFRYWKSLCQSPHFSS